MRSIDIPKTSQLSKTITMSFEPNKDNTEQQRTRFLSTNPTYPTIPKTESPTSFEKREWVKSTRATVNFASPQRVTATKQFLATSKNTTVDDTEKAFSPTTRPSTSFVPIVPRMWIATNKTPSKDDICKLPELYKDLNLFVTSPSEWLEKSVLDQLPFYGVPKELKVLVCTWNINQGVFSQDVVNTWTQYISEGADLVCAGVQELDMSVDALITGNKYSEKADKWESLLLTSLNKTGRDEYVDSGWYQLCGVVLFTFVKKSIKSLITKTGIGSCRTGAIGGTLANKGGVVIGFQIYDSTICFVNSHLAAHQGFLERRNKDWEEISKIRVEYLSGAETTRLNVLDHDIVVWLGDLNYRIDLDDQEVRKLVVEKDFNTLYRNDQLYTSRMKKKVFHNFVEARLNFLPTFKINQNGEYNDKRIPSWCDRILYKTERRHGVTVEKYNSFELYNSDHKPVSGVFKVCLQQINQVKKKTVIDFFNKAEEWYRNVVVPEVSAPVTYFEFKEPELMKSYSQTLSIRNIGKTRMYLEMKKSKEYEDAVQYSWVKIDMSTDHVDITEGKDEVLITATVNYNQNNSFLYQNKEACKFVFEIAVKFTKHVIPMIIKVFPKQTCVGLSLNELCLLNTPVIGMTSNVYDKSPFYVPKEVYRIVDKMKSLREDELEYLFQFEPNEKQFNDVLQAVDNDLPFRTGISASSYFAVLLLIVAGFKDSLLHDDFLSQIQVMSQNEVMVKRYLTYMMLESHKNLYVFLVKFISNLILKGVDKNRLLDVFSKVLIHTQKSDTDLITSCYNFLEKSLQIL
ncbi:type II inositol-1,4,5-trisphosphate 5-phosphatase precursor, putative [Entamoeba invadens IP1]|uniref:Type II inositol-1,4,5-trisphosphate 5-phosphatase, putative n=1 Tax=Entamoeba invadens IP1 TaxID=370355 RepID=A0A0A1TU85_ENTIV|nr:type II inositol-1,4,5-trisphosphate 5-phosphatase precursor, putative [Entamoeba invadens IP1]ELP83484.1 type II inositol-1,4,5-trisphosphate 5-phosphatase precursor, putative [Entamoeba invadens IP1]|eukprot:XP_004182830.1 type II inositol-1,4,5-trisphosphate 5-phosphatase precursor, putative [Entamoeba invadens IP1]